MADEVMRKAAVPLETDGTANPKRTGTDARSRGVQKVLTTPYHAVYEPTVIHALL